MFRVALFSGPLLLSGSVSTLAALLYLALNEAMPERQSVNGNANICF